MEKEFLQELGLAPETVDAIMTEHGRAVQEKDAAMAQLRLEHAVETAVHRYGGRNVRAVAALLDMDGIQKSQDVSGALDAALKALKKENGWLFESPAPPPYARFTGAVQTPAPKATTLAGALRERMGK